MPGSAADVDLTRARARHAAPRKSLLTKIHIPAGKAMALAAMPTAVFVGMSLTPKLAMADDSKAAPSTSGACVTRSDEPSASDSPSPSASPSDSPSASASPSSSDGTSSKGGKDSGKSGSGKASDGGKASGGGSSDPQPSATSSASPTPTPDPSTSSPSSHSGSGGGGLLGGLGSALGGLLGVHSDSSSPSPSATPSHDTTPSPSASHSATSSKDSKGDGGSSKDTSSKDTSGKAGDALGKTVKGTLGGLSKAAKDAGKSASSSKSPSASGSSDSGKKDGKDGKGDGSSESATQSKEQAIRDLLTHKGVKFSDATADTKSADTKAGSGSCDEGPCDLLPILKPPTQDANAPTMAADPWHLQSSNLSLKGLCYRGLVDIKTASGATKRVMKFTADSIGIKDLHQTVDNRDGHGNIVRHTEIKTKPGTTSTIDGPVTMYTEKLSGNLLGLLPITFSPDFPPPIQIPSVFFTNAKVDQAGQFGGTLKMQGLHNFID
ncbi:hypothetical protein [Streptomyces montanisoli]|uniref:Hydrogenase expression protein HypF n=1 Tax=Streptomyces montanisoli TaxID=2798581 RepID=A0A940RTJ9_9ACTN|nr:hypothetical protein [Streptomyces montanisoli]MBP0456952.1 hypothetical protein [Streptomyces montanisoli]